MPRRNGWECVWNIQQILSMLLLFSSAGFYAFIYIAATRTNFDEPRQSPWTKTVGSLMLFGAAWLLLLTSVLILAAGILIGSNPADPLIQKEISGESTPQAYCTICNKHVHPTSLHCKYCDKCVLRMDHHCFFVNNCIGKRNYRLYIAVMILTLVYLVSNCFGSVLIFIFHYTAASILSSIAETYSLDDRALQAACGCFAVLFAIFSLFLGDLLRLHWVLYKKKMTTMEYSRFLRAQNDLDGGTRSMTVVDCVGKSRWKKRKRNEVSSQVHPNPDIGEA